MTRLASRPPGANPGAVEGTSLHAQAVPDQTTIPTRFFLDPQFKGADLRVVAHLCRRDAAYRSGLNFESKDEIARGSGVTVRKVQDTITKLTRAELMEVRPGLYKGSPVTVRVLRFLPTGAADAAHGYAPRSLKSAPAAHGHAPEPAHDDAPDKSIKRPEGDVNDSGALAGGDGEQDATSQANPVAVAPPTVMDHTPIEPSPDPEPTPPPPDQAEVDRLIAVVRSKAGPGVRKPAFWALEGWGLLPPDLTGLFKSLPASEPTKPRRPEPTPAGPPPDPIFGGLPGLDPIAAEAECDRLAQKCEDEFRDAMYRPFFKARVRDVVERRIDPVDMAKAFARAKKSTAAEKPGAIFTKELRRRIGYDGPWKDFVNRPFPGKEARR